MILDLLDLRNLCNCMAINNHFLKLIGESEKLWKKKAIRFENIEEMENVKNFYLQLEREPFEQKMNVYYLHMKYKLFSSDGRNFWREISFRNNRIKKRVSKESLMNGFDESHKRDTKKMLEATTTL